MIGPIKTPDFFTGIFDQSARSFSKSVDHIRGGKTLVLESFNSSITVEQNQKRQIIFAGEF